MKPNLAAAHPSCWSVKAAGLIAMTIATATATAAVALAQSPDDLTVEPGRDVPATIEGQSVMLRVLSAGPDRLVLNAQTAARLGLKPAVLVGRANLNVAGRREFEGRNRPADFIIGGIKHNERVLWFPTAPAQPADGTIGPWALRHNRVTFAFGTPDPTAVRHDFPMFGTVDTGSVAGYREATFGMGVAFDLDDPSPYPRASAAAGAAIARVYGGSLSGPTWDVEILFGIMRPVRLLTLERPLVIGPLRFTKIAVRVRDRIDASGRGRDIPDADMVEDPSEVVVTAKAKGPRPVFSFAVPRAAMADCARLSFDKRAKRIELWCKPGG